MITIVYTVEDSTRSDEEKWLREQRIFPAITPAYDWATGKNKTRFGVIVSKEQALAVKLRHKLELQADYKQR